MDLPALAVIATVIDVHFRKLMSQTMDLQGDKGEKHNLSKHKEG